MNASTRASFHLEACSRPRPRSLGVLLVLAILATAPNAVRAQVLSLEVVGAVPLDAATRRSGGPKDRAIAEALWQGVSRVAADLLAESMGAEQQLDQPETGSGPDPVRRALGKDMLPYTRRFRIVEDQGERPALFTDHPDAATEYVVVVAVEVDVERVRERLLQAGLIEQSGGEILTGMRLEVRGLTQYRGYQELLELLLGDDVGAASIDPLEFERGLAVLRVQADRGPGELLERLLAAAPQSLRITPIAVQEGRDADEAISAEPSALVISVQWTPPEPDPAGKANGSEAAEQARAQRASPAAVSAPPGSRRR